MAVRGWSLAVVLVMSAAPGFAQGNPYSQRVLFSVRYAFERGCIRVHAQFISQRLLVRGPLLGAIAVDDAHVYLAGDGWAYVMEFTRDGELAAGGDSSLYRSDLPHEPHQVPADYRQPPSTFFTGLLDFARDPRGFSYLLCEPDTRVLVCNPEHGRLTSHSWDGIRGELRGGEKLFYQLRRQLGIVWPRIQAVACDREGHLYLRVETEDEQHAAQAGVALAKFDENQDFLGWRRGQYVGPDGSTYALVADEGGVPLSRLDRFDPDGQPGGSISLVPRGREAGDDYDPETGWQPMDDLLVDGEGRLYLVYSDPAAWPSHEGWEKVELDVRIYLFDAAGRWLPGVSLQSLARTTVPPAVTVDAVGNMYYARYGQEALEVHCLERG